MPKGRIICFSKNEYSSIETGGVKGGDKIFILYKIYKSVLLSIAFMTPQ